MKVLYSHHGMKGKNGWGRTFYMAQGLADLYIIRMNTRQNSYFIHLFPPYIAGQSQKFS